MNQFFARQPLAWTTAENEGPTLRRALGWPALTAIGLGTMLGGIFPTIGAGAHVAGPAVILAFTLSGVVSLCVVLCYAEFASMVPVAGSAYTYAYATLGEIIAWVIGWDLILEYGLSLAPTASSWSDYAQHLLGSIGIHVPAWAQTASLGSGQIDVIAALSVLAITMIVTIGIRESSSVNASLVVFQIVSMIAFIAITAHAVHPVNLKPFTPSGWNGILSSTALVFFAYIGFDTVTVASEEAHMPHRNVPIGIVLALAIGTLLYVSLTVCTVGVIPFNKLSDGAAMLDALSAVTRNPGAYWLVALGGLAGNATVMLTGLLGQVRIFYVMSRDKLLPPQVARIHPRFRTPATMTMVTGSVVTILAAIFPLSDLLKMVNIGTLAAFAVVCIGVLVLRVINPTAERPFKAPLVWIFGGLGSMSCFYLIYGLDPMTWLRYASWFVVGMIAYFGYGFWNSRMRSSKVSS